MVDASCMSSLPVKIDATYWPLLRLGEGGMAIVDLAYRSTGRFRRFFALKRLRPEFRNEPQVRNMFVDEGRLAGLISHPNVSAVVDVGDDEQGPFLISEYVDGLPLSAMLANMAAAGTRLALPAALAIAWQAARGLHAAHELTSDDGTFLGLVHRDVAPQNILVGYDGFVRVADFSIARAWGRLTQTAAGAQKGKVGYMSPEQLRFEPLDRRSDLFALGVVLFEMLAGARLYQGEVERDVARRVIAEPPPDIGEHRADVPPALVGLLFSLLAKNKLARPTDAAEVAAELHAALVEHIEPVTGPFDLGVYMRQRFADERQRHLNAVREAVARLAAQEAP